MLDYWREIVGVAAVVLIVASLLWTVRSSKTASSHEAGALPEPAVIPVTAEEQDAPAPQIDSLRQELSSRVRQDPDKMADALKNWLRDAA